MKKGRKRKEEIAEDYCFICKDGGLLIVCEHARCLKAYHPECVGKDSTVLETNERWICGCHTCFICRKPSKYHCFCCPMSVCRGCTNAAEFVLFKKKKGFCNDCLKLALLVEENLDVDSDGGKVDFKDTETYEFLFKDYWQILIKDKEGFLLEDLRNLDAQLKTGENCADVFSSDEVELVSDDKKAMKKKHKSRRKEFTGWGSKELIQFLTAIGKNTDESISQCEVHDIILNYIKENNLLHPQRKKKVLCDARLHHLFRRRSVNRLRIFDLLEAHFPKDQVPEDKSLYSSEDDTSSVASKRRRRSRSDGKLVPNDFKDKVLNLRKKLYASVTTKNIKLLYLRRSLIEDFLKSPDTFDCKVIGCFVRVKCNLKDHSSKSFFQLMQVTAIKKASEAYTIGEISTNICLMVSNMDKDIRICMLSDEDFSEEECEDLHKRMKEGLLKRPRLVEFEEKARSLHEDITKHWIDREIVMLQKLIDRANEKGWRRELYEYIERQEQLQTPSERVRLLKEFPQVIADAEIDLEPTQDSSGNGASLNQIVSYRNNEGNSAVSHWEAEKHETTCLTEQQQPTGSEELKTGNSDTELDKLDITDDVDSAIPMVELDDSKDPSFAYGVTISEMVEEMNASESKQHTSSCQRKESCFE